ncbi:MAG: hypothetical protein M3Q47_10915 [Actinomycetota bacterium]|nr:hypothetical protein [Actinomycetota bacterium]
MSVVARSLRGDDWLGRSGPDKFAVLLGGSVDGAEAAATRVVTTIGDLGIPGLGACAGIAGFEAGATAAGTLQHATASLQSARTVGPGTVIRHTGRR